MRDKREDGGLVAEYGSRSRFEREDKRLLPFIT
jgi:hypothetical protein